MNILHVFGTHRALSSWLMQDTMVAGTDYTRSVANSGGHLELCGVRFTCLVISNSGDVERVRGNKFDLIMYHDSFGRHLYEKGRQLDIHHIDHRLKLYCLRT